jgi:hypothetical protein
MDHLSLQDQSTMNLKSKYTAGRPSEEVLPMSSSQWNTEVLEEEPAFRLAGEPSAFSFDFGYIAAPFFNQHEDWDDDDEEEEDIDLDDDDDDDEIWEEEDFDVDEEDFEVEEEDDVDFDSFDDDEEEDVFEDEPEDRGHWVEDPNLLPCSPGYAIEARAESHQGKMK